MSVILENIREESISTIKKFVQMKSIEQNNADFIVKLINNAETTDEVISIMQLVTNYKPTGFHYDVRLEKSKGSTIKYFKKNEDLSFSGNNENALTHKLIVGDNYDALLNLLIQYKGKIDLIYIDPPYGKDKMGEFAKTNYDNSITRDNLLSMLHPRLILAKQLLSEQGVIFCSCDDKNQAYFKCLFDEVFGEQNFIASNFVLDNLKGKANDNFITSVGSKLLVYAKNKSKSNEQGFNQVENIFGDKIETKYKYEDENGFYTGITFKKTGQSKLRKDRPYMFYPILQKDGKLFSITKEEFEKIYDKNLKTFNDRFIKSLQNKYHDYEFILPTDKNNIYLRWTSGFDTFVKNMNNTIFYDNGVVKQKVRPKSIEMMQYYASGTPKTFMYKASYANGTDDLKSVLGDSQFDFPKSVSLLIDILKLYPSSNCIILDFFAGSGTTGQAVMQLNREDGGNRQFILCTSNEITDINPNGVVLDVTSKRLKRVMTGKCYDDSTDFNWIKKNAPYGDNLDVYEIDTVANFNTETNKTPFDVIDETLYGKEKFKTVKEKVDWVCNNFDNTQFVLKNIGDENATRS